MANKKDFIVKSTIERKTFEYTKGPVNLSFTLRTDNTSELKPWLECLEEAEKDVRELLALMKN
jgi:hypothetical protein